MLTAKSFGRVLSSAVLTTALGFGFAASAFAATDPDTSDAQYFQVPAAGAATEQSSSAPLLGTAVNEAPVAGATDTAPATQQAPQTQGATEIAEPAGPASAVPAAPAQAEPAPAAVEPAAQAPAETRVTTGAPTQVKEATAAEKATIVASPEANPSLTWMIALGAAVVVAGGAAAVIFLPKRNSGQNPVQH